MSNSKSLVLIGPAYPYRGGPAAVIGHLYHLLAQSWDVHVVSFSRLYPKLLFPGSRQEDTSAHPIMPHPSERIIDSIGPTTWLHTSKRIRELTPKLILLDWYQPFFGLCYGAILRRVRDVAPIVILAENIISHEARWIDWYLTRRTFRYGDGFVAFSEAVAKRLREMYPNRPIERAYLPLFITPERSPRTWTAAEAKEQLGIAGKRMLLFFGYIRPYKGLSLLIEAFAKLVQKHPDTVLFIVGECYENPARYHQLISAHGLDQQVRWINHYVANEEVPLYYSAADIVVLPYRSATQSGVQRIAFAFDKPVVVTDVGGLAEEVHAFGAGEVVPPNDSSELAAALDRMLSMPTLEHYIEGARRARQATQFEQIAGLIERFSTMLSATDT